MTHDATAAPILLDIPAEPAESAPALTMDEVFGPGGLMARNLPDYQPRESQLIMAREVADALAGSHNLMVEAPCGVGKSLAYSVPAILHALATGQRVLIATANIALQEQLVHKDLPFLTRILPEPFQFTLLKGRGHYLCRAKHDEERSRLFASVDRDGEREEFERVLAWAEETGTGDSSELPFKVSPRVRRHFFVADTNECAGCGHLCFHKAAAAEAELAQVVVCNYHVLFAHLMVQQATAGKAGVLPAFDALICDEAHEIPDIGRDFASEQIGRWSFRGFQRHLSHAGFKSLDAAAEQLDQKIRLLGFQHGAPGSGRIKEAGLIDIGPMLMALRSTHRELKAAKRQHQEGTLEFKLLERQQGICTQLGRRVKALAWQQHEGWVYWTEHVESASRESWKLSGKPVCIAAFVRQALLSWLPSFIATSATLTTTPGDFRFLRERIGLSEHTRQVALPSPFHFERAALLVVPRGLPDPGAPEYRDQIHDQLHDAVLHSRGRALLLFTSSQALRTAHQTLAPEFERRGIRCHCQGEAPSRQLIQQFQDDVSSVLFATRTFFQGIDVPGESLSLVALDRLPFPSPADPVMDYIVEHNPKGWFSGHSLPIALITWRQIFGRLIRRQDDKGCVLLLDGRVTSKKYGRQFLKALPGGRLSHETASIASFLADDEDPFA
jgi:ATP-dependent DNA helicase DinG